MEVYGNVFAIESLMESWPAKPGQIRSNFVSTSMKKG